MRRSVSFPFVDGEFIRLASIHGMTEAGVEAARRVFPMRRTDETIMARAIRTRSVCHVSDVLSDPQYQQKDIVRITGHRGCLGVPMSHQGPRACTRLTGASALRPGAEVARISEWTHQRLPLWHREASLQ